MSDLFSVVLTDPSYNQDPANVQKLNNCLQRGAKILAYDALRYARDSQGVLMDNLPFDTAQKLVGELSANGIESALVLSSLMPFELEKKNVRQIAVDNDGVSLQIGYTGMQNIPWDEISLVSICLHQSVERKAVREKKPRRGFSFGRIAATAAGGAVGAALYRYKTSRKNAAKRNKYKLDVNEIYIADIYTLDPVTIYRIKSNECHYNYLGERVLERAEWNFNTVINDIYEVGESVMFSPLAMRYIEGDSLQDNVIVEMTEFDSYNRWLFLAAAAFADKYSDESDIDYSEDNSSKAITDDFAFE